MKILDHTPISNSAQFFPKKGTLNFLQLAYKEMFSAITKFLIGPTYNAGTMYVLYGVTNSGSGSTYIIASGVVFYNGELYEVDAASFVSPGSELAIFQTIQTQFTTDADPCVFSDATTHNIHNIRKIKVLSGATGSGLADYSQAAFLNFVIPAQLNLTAPLTAPYADNVAQINGVYPNLEVYVPTPIGSANPVLLIGNYNVGNPVVDETQYIITFPSALADANYMVVGSLIPDILTSQRTHISWGVFDKTVNGFKLVVKKIVNGSYQNFSLDYAVIKQ